MADEHVSRTHGFRISVRRQLTARVTSAHSVRLHLKQLYITFRQKLSVRDRIETLRELSSDDDKF